MDLRDKPGKIQKLMELLLRFRLIFVVLLVVFSVSFFATQFQSLNTLPLASSGAFSEWFARLENVSVFWSSAQYLVVAFIAYSVLVFVFAGLKSGLANIVSLILFGGALLFLDGAEGMQGIFFGVFTGIALLLLLFAKWSVSCVLFPFALSWLLLTGFIGIYPFEFANSALLWGLFSALGFSGIVAFAFAAGSLLASGTPESGALVKAGKKMLFPVILGTLLVLSALTVDAQKYSAEIILGALLFAVAFIIWFFGFLFGTLSFAPWARLRSSSRRVEMKDKKKNRKK